nr:Ig-like domain-containing protein [uncultured Sulfurimonas sp.]
MATTKLIGRVEVSIGDVKIVDVNGNLRGADYGGLMYEGEQVYSADANALFQIKYLSLPEATAYDGVFRVLADGSVISGLEGNENYFGDDIDFMETAAGNEGAQGSSAFLEEVPLDESSLLEFNRGVDDTNFGSNIVNFGGVSETDFTPPVITSQSDIIFDENNPNAVMTITATDTSALTFSISGADSALFSIDSNSGELRFNNAPNYENPLDAGANNEYNILVTVTDALGNFTTQALSININNLNDNMPTANDANASATEDVYDDINAQLSGEDADGNEIRYELVSGLGEDEGNLTFSSDGSYTYNVGHDFQDLGEGETREVTFTYKTVEVGPPLSEPSDAGPFESEVATVTILVTGTNDAPVAMAENITKIADHVEVTISPDDPANSYYYGAGGWYQIVQDGDGDYGVNQLNITQPDSNSEIDSLGANEHIVFTFAQPVTSADISYANFDSDDNASYRLFMNGHPVTGKIYNEPNGTLSVESGVEFNAIVIYAEEADGCPLFNWTDFQVSNVVGYSEVDTMLPFVIDDSMLLANDTDVEGDALSIGLVDGRLLDASGVEIGSVAINDDGDIQVTPNSDVDFDASVGAYANFAYVVSDEDGASSQEVTATIDLEVGSVVGTQVGYIADGAQEFIIGTDADAADALSNNVLSVSDALDLSNVSAINTIDLDEDATVSGSGELGHITAADVLDATDIDNTLVIQSSGNAYDQVNVHESFGEANTVFNDGQWYAEYSSDGATLLVEIDPPIDAV